MQAGEVNRGRYREHVVPPRSDVRSSLGRFVGESRLTDAEIEDRVARAYRDGVFVFTRSMYEQMAPYEQLMLDGLARRFIERRG